MILYNYNYRAASCSHLHVSSPLGYTIQPEVVFGLYILFSMLSAQIHYL